MGSSPRAQTPYHGSPHWDAVHSGAGAGAGAVVPEAGTAVAALHAAAGAALGPAGTRGRRLLDVGCGDGGFLRGLPPVWDRVGLDFSGAGLRRARHAGDGSAGSGERGCTWLRADAGRIPLRDGGADAAVCLCGIWTFADPVRVLRELGRVVGPHGRVLVHLWGPPAQCRLLTVGAVAVARVLPGMEVPQGVTGPFDVTPQVLTGWAGEAGWPPPEGRYHRHMAEITGLSGYWREFAALAPTAYAAYRGADGRQRSRIDALVTRLLEQTRERTGTAELPLGWWLFRLGAPPGASDGTS